MKNQIRLGIKLLKYGLNAKLQLGCAALVLVLGLALELISGGHNLSVVGGFYIVLSGTFLAQVIISLDVSKMVQTSSYKRKIQTSMPVLVNTSIQLASYTVVVLLRLYRLSQIPADDIEGRIAVGTNLAGIICLIFIFSVYLGFCYKFFLISVVIVVLIAVPLMVGLQVGACQIGRTIPMAAIVVSGYILIPAGQLLAYLFSRLVYKRELSLYAFGSAMRREMRQ